MANDPDPLRRPIVPPGGDRSTAEAMKVRASLGLAIRGLLGMLLGLALISTPAVPTLPFAMLAAAFMLLEGVFVITLIVLRIVHARERRRLRSWGGWLALGGLVVASYGALLIRAMTVEPVVFTSSLGAFTILFGVALLGLAFRLRPHRHAPPMLAGPFL
jgi:uncharacterized membrane protein HdeD (DUF308 family)